MKTKSLVSRRPQRSLIQWRSERQVAEVSTRLAQMVKVGVRWEANGDYFASEDLAYQIQEIIRATEELLKKRQRLKH
jgi:hypothetical protein